MSHELLEFKKEVKTISEDNLGELVKSLDVQIEALEKQKIENHLEGHFKGVRIMRDIAIQELKERKNRVDKVEIHTGDKVLRFSKQLDLSKDEK